MQRNPCPIEKMTYTKIAQYNRKMTNSYKGLVFVQNQQGYPVKENELQAMLYSWFELLKPICFERKGKNKHTRYTTEITKLKQRQEA